MTQATTPGDRILIDLGNGTCNIDKIDAGGHRVVIRADVPLNEGWTIARGGASEDRGQVWLAHWSAPDYVRPWISPTGSAPSGPVHPRSQAS